MRGFCEHCGVGPDCGVCGRGYTGPSYERPAPRFVWPVARVSRGERLAAFLVDCAIFAAVACLVFLVASCYRGTP